LSSRLRRKAAIPAEHFEQEILAKLVGADIIVERRIGQIRELEAGAQRRVVIQRRQCQLVDVDRRVGEKDHAAPAVGGEAEKAAVTTGAPLCQIVPLPVVIHASPMRPIFGTSRRGVCASVSAGSNGDGSVPIAALR
jgi:hypothetical protein